MHIGWCLASQNCRSLFSCWQWLSSTPSSELSKFVFWVKLVLALERCSWICATGGSSSCLFLTEAVFFNGEHESMVQISHVFEIRGAFAHYCHSLSWSNKPEQCRNIHQGILEPKNQQKGAAVSRGLPLSLNSVGWALLRHLSLLWWGRPSSPLKEILAD